MNGWYTTFRSEPYRVRSALIVGRIGKQRERFGKVQIEVTAPLLRAVTAAGSGSVDI